MKELKNHPFMDRRTVKAWETNGGGYVQVTDVRDLYHGQYSVERGVQGGLDGIYSSTNLAKCIEKAERYAAQH